MEIALIVYMRHNLGWWKRHICGSRSQSAVYPRFNQLLSMLCTSTRGIPQ